MKHRWNGARQRIRVSSARMFWGQLVSNGKYTYNLVKCILVGIGIVPVNALLLTVLKKTWWLFFWKKRLFWKTTYNTRNSFKWSMRGIVPDKSFRNNELKEHTQMIKFNFFFWVLHCFKIWQQVERRYCATQTIWTKMEYL